MKETHWTQDAAKVLNNLAEHDRQASGLHQRAGSPHSCATKMVEVIDNAATGEHARKERKRMGRSLREVARRLRVSAAFLSDLELGRRNWDDKRLVEFMMVVHGVPGPPTLNAENCVYQTSGSHIEPARKPNL